MSRHRVRNRPPPLGRVWRGAGSQLAELTPEEIPASGDHELLNWIVALGIIGDKPAEIVDVRELHTRLAFRVAAVWEP
ncbi:MAG TPA: hypothetical protein VNP04_18720 [Alphaproteobacteria bacterium]|nr:hypothetical protein [Alphaproteobacteria bacterium]